MILESKLLVSLVLGNGNIARKLVPEIGDWVYFLKLASNNRLLYFSSRELLEVCSEQMDTETKDVLRMVKSGGDDVLEKQRSSLHEVRGVLESGGIRSLVIKTFKNYDYVFNDLDILVPESNFEKSVRLISRLGSSSVCRKGQIDIVLENGTKVDLHSEFYRYGRRRLDTNFLWENPRQIEWGGRSVAVPSCGAEFLLTSANIVLERRYFSLLDFCHLKSLLDGGADLALCRKQVDRGGWGKSFTALVSEFSRLSFASTFPRLISAETVLTSFGQALSFSSVSEKTIFKEFLYWFFSGARFYLTSGRRVPFYGHWFDFDKLKTLL